MTTGNAWQGSTLPPTWPFARLKDHVQLTNGFPFDSARFTNSGTRLVRIRDLAADTDLVFIDGELPAYARVNDGDLLIGMDGDFAAVTWRSGPAVLNQRLCRLRARAGLDQRYLAYVLPAVLKSINDVTYSTTVKHLSSSDLVNERIPLPSKSEQRAIADFLDAETARIDALIASRLRMLALTHERRLATARSGVCGQLTSHSETRPSSLPWLTELPVDWREVQLKLVARLGSGHTPSRSHPEWWIDCVVPWVTTGEVAGLRNDDVEFITTTREKISEAGIVNSSAEIHPAGTVVLSRTASVGFSGILGAPMATSQDFATWTCGPLLRPRFLLLCLRAMRQDLLGRLATGSTHKTIYMPDIESIRIPLPMIAEQDSVVSEVWTRLIELQRLTERVQAQILLLRERRRALITAAVTGEIDVSTASGRGVPA